MNKDFIKIGNVVAPHGIKGEVRVYPVSDTKEFLLKFKEVFLKSGDKLEVSLSRVHKNVVIFKFLNIDSRNDTTSILNKEVFIKKKDVKLPKNRVFIEDLIGLKVYDADDNTYYGELKEVSTGVGNDIYHIQGEKNLFLIPAISDFVIKIDLRNKKILIRPIEGLLDI